MRKLKTFLFVCVVFLSLSSAYNGYAQYEKRYFFYMGRYAIIEGRYRDAIDLLNVLLSVDEKAHEGYMLRGVAKYNLGDLLGAESDFGMAINANKVYTLAYQYRAIIRLQLGNYDDALNDFQHAIELRPDIVGPYYSRGVTYLLSQQFEKAIKDFDTFISKERMVSDAYIRRGTCYLLLKDTTRAYEDYNMAIKTNRNNPNGYNLRGSLYLAQNKTKEALEDFNKAIDCDSTFIPALFRRAIVHWQNKRLTSAIEDFNRVLKVDPTHSFTYFNRAILRTDIGDYNNALEDYNMVATYSPNNVLTYYNRALLNTRLGNIENAIEDYSRAIEIHPDFANAYLGRSQLRAISRDIRGARRDKEIADLKIAEYRSKISDSTFSIYADTSRRFNQLISFDDKLTSKEFQRMGNSGEIVMKPLFKFNYVGKDSLKIDPKRYYLPRMEEFTAELSDENIRLSTKNNILSADSLNSLYKVLKDSVLLNPGDWRVLFKKGMVESLIRQYTNSIESYTAAIYNNPLNPFLYINRSTAQSEMIDFISSIDNRYQRIVIDSDPANKLKSGVTRTYNYDEALRDLDTAIKLYPDCAYFYYNKGNLLTLTGKLPEAFVCYSKAIDLNPNFAEAYFNRGLIQIQMKDNRKGYLDISKAGELGIEEAYSIVRKYSKD